MGKYLLIIGLLINCIYIIINRFVKRLPNCIAIPILIVGIILMISGVILMK